MKIWIGCDHAGFDRKQEVVALLRERGLEVEDCGCNGERADYPVIARRLELRLPPIRRTWEF